MLSPGLSKLALSVWDRWSAAAVFWQMLFSFHLMTHFIFPRQQPSECLLASIIHKWLCQQNTIAVGLLQQGIMYPSLNFPYSFISQPLKKKRERDLNEDLYILDQT